MESKQWLEQELRQIRRWERSQGGSWFWERIGKIPFKILDKLTPAFIHRKIGTALDEIGKFIQTGGGYLSSEKAVSGFFQDSQIRTLADVPGLPIRMMDTAAERVGEGRSKAAAVQGASTGIGGIFTLSIDIPLLLGLQLKTLQDIAMCYGYDPKLPEERLFIVKIMQFVSSDASGKKLVLKQLGLMNENPDAARKEVVSELRGWREVVYSYRERWGWKKLFQMVPVAGFVFGAITNRGVIRELAEAGKVFYRKRRIEERLEWYDRDA
ncbi:EcsC family protein [Bhargavaea cecembensis]|uniref:EcsC family protein n=1 Tax=Bhargavaea cecembensis TaxID=394098 RepID=UPI000590854A|nr:EcsC family protein [Bhargavaea cecembensis]